MHKNPLLFKAALPAVPLLSLLLSACAATQSATAFTLRAASSEEPVTVTADDKAALHDQALSDSLERSLERQEREDQAEPVSVEPQKPTRDATASRPPRSESVAIVR
jgi:hypothetical protein